MKPINSKDRTKAFWQFIFIFFAMCIVPVGIIAFSFIQIPEEVSAADQAKLQEYTAYEHTKKQLIKQMSVIDSNMTMLANHTSNLSDDILAGNITNSLAKLNDSDQLVSRIHNNYNNNYTTIQKLNAAIKENKKIADDLQAAKAKLSVNESNNAFGMQGH